MLKRIGLIGLTSAALTFVFAACGEGGGPGGATCTSDADCATTEICHPQAQVCVQTCTSSADCPDSAKTCEAIDGTAGGDAGTGTSICKCTTDALCAGGNALGSSTICSKAFEVCVTKCGSNTDCPSGFECDTATGQCAAAACDSNDDCPSGQTCNTSSGQCVVAASCSAANPPPDVCSYGQFCGAGDKCEAVPEPTCSNFTMSGHGASWDPATSTGPVIWSLTQEGTTSAGAGCTNFSARVKAYRTTGTFPTTRTALAPTFHVVRPDGIEIDSSTVIDGTTIQVTNGGKNIEFVIKPCGTGMPYSLGAHFDQGNETCASINL